MRYTLAELDPLETLSIDQTSDLKIDTGTKRVWLSRCDETSGEPYLNKVVIERFKNGRWTITETYQAL